MVSRCLWIVDIVNVIQDGLGLDVMLSVQLMVKLLMVNVSVIMTQDGKENCVMYQAVQVSMD